MKKIKIFILLFALFNIFIFNVGVEAFNCDIGNYTVEYDSNGNIVSAQSKTSNEKVTKSLSSYFKPKNESECPTSKTAKISIIDGGRTFYVAKIDETFGDPETNSQQKENMGSCMGYDNEKSCEYNSYYSCIWNETEYGDFCNTDELLYVDCGDAFDIPYQAPSIIAFAINLLKIATPIVLIIVSVISLLKALASSKEDEIKKAKSSLIRKLIAAVLVFFIISIVQFVILKVADVSEKNNISDCLSCFLNNDCEDSVYYKNNVGGIYKCKYLKSGVITNCKGNE